MIVEVNEKQPRIFGRTESELHIDQVDVIIEAAPHTMGILPNRPYGDLDRKIAEIVVERMEDEATVQLGIGALPNAIGDVIADSSLKDLGVHTEMYVDSFMKMTLAGKVTGMKKTLDRGRQVSAFWRAPRPFTTSSTKTPPLWWDRWTTSTVPPPSPLSTK